MKVYLFFLNIKELEINESEVIQEGDDIKINNKN